MHDLNGFNLPRYLQNPHAANPGTTSDFEAKPVVKANGGKNPERNFLVVAADNDLIYPIFIGLVAFEIL